MEQNEKYFCKTATALQKLNQEIETLNSAVDSAELGEIILKEKITEYKNELHQKAARIDSIIENLNGALK